jgi:hypothetical protein
MTRYEYTEFLAELPSEFNVWLGDQVSICGNYSYQLSKREWNERFFIFMNEGCDDNG